MQNLIIPAYTHSHCDEEFIVLLVLKNTVLHLVPQID